MGTVIKSPISKNKKISQYNKVKKVRVISASDVQRIVDALKCSTHQVMEVLNGRSAIFQRTKERIENIVGASIPKIKVKKEN